MYSSFVRFVKSISRNCDIRLFWKNLVRQVILEITWDYVYTSLYQLTTEVIDYIIFKFFFVVTLLAEMSKS